ncbi:MAG: hypothetical protein Q7S02_05720 [bacterium]|nr:hypothetical protein [bacterium]
MRERSSGARRIENDPNLLYQESLLTLEREVLYGPSATPPAEHTEELRSLARAAGQSPGLADFFEGNVEHQRANDYYGAFLASTDRVAALSGDEFRGTFARFPQRDALEKAETHALDAYTAASASWWRTRFLSAMDGRLYANDLHARRAVRIADPEERQRAQDDADRALLSLIPEIEDAGKRAEYQCTLLLRRWARGRELDHVIDVVHSSPRDDIQGKDDLVMSIGSNVYRVSVKALSEDAYRTEYNEALIARGQRKADAASAVLSVVSMEDLRDVFRAETSGGRTPTAARQRVMKSFVAQFPDEAQALLTTLVAPAPKSERPQQRLTDRYLQEHVNPPMLIAFGVLAEQDRNNVSRVMDAKRRFIAAALSILKTVENFDTPPEDLRERMKQAMGS